MKRILISLLVITTTLGLFAQSETDVLTTKRGVPILPAPGDFAFGIDATPFFRFAGNLFSGNNPYYPSFGFTAQAPGSIFGKYKASESTTYRAAVLIGYSNEKFKEENSVDSDLVDELTSSAISVGLSAGIEQHRNIFGRISGYFGGQAGISLEPYSFYDNQTNNTYYGTFRYVNANNSDFNYNETGGSTLGVFAGGLVGVEFFVAPRISLTGEFGYNLTYHSQGERIGKPATGDEEILDLGNSGINLMPASSGNLVLLFYF